MLEFRLVFHGSSCYCSLLVVVLVYTRQACGGSIRLFLLLCLVYKPASLMGIQLGYN